MQVQRPGPPAWSFLRSLTYPLLTALMMHPAERNGELEFEYFSLHWKAADDERAFAVHNKVREFRGSSVPTADAILRYLEDI